MLNEHRQPAHGVTAADGDGLALRLAKFVSHLAEKLKLEFGITSQQRDEHVDSMR